jgi:hypothetical protein
VRSAAEAGAIVIGKTTMPEVGLWPFTESITWGVTRNPWGSRPHAGGLERGLSGRTRPRRGAGPLRRALARRRV